MTTKPFANGPHVPGLAFAFRVTMYMGERMRFGKGATGLGRGYASAAHGVIEGPRLNGKVLENSGGDYAIFRPDHTVQFNAHYVLQADDGTYIYMNNSGFRHGTPEVNARLEANEVLDPSEYYFRMRPVFDCPKGPHDWLTRTVIIGTADRREDHSIFDYYAVV